MIAFLSLLFAAAYTLNLKLQSGNKAPIIAKTYVDITNAGYSEQELTKDLSTFFKSQTKDFKFPGSVMTVSIARSKCKGTVAWPGNKELFEQYIYNEWIYLHKIYKNKDC
eukprot:NODE_397_length_8118_cov_0.510787.p2 type:complete len:110 gc:universal NODE_397_length_8118_cov_0.510787:332-3(-)